MTQNEQTTSLKEDNLPIAPFSINDIGVHDGSIFSIEEIGKRFSVDNIPSSSPTFSIDEIGRTDFEFSIDDIGKRDESFSGFSVDNIPSSSPTFSIDEIGRTDFEFSIDDIGKRDEDINKMEIIIPKDSSKDLSPSYQSLSEKLSDAETTIKIKALLLALSGKVENLSVDEAFTLIDKLKMVVAEKAKNPKTKKLYEETIIVEFFRKIKDANPEEYKTFFEALKREGIDLSEKMLTDFAEDTMLSKEHISNIKAFARANKPPEIKELYERILTKLEAAGGDLNQLSPLEIYLLSLTATRMAGFTADQAMSEKFVSRAVIQGDAEEKKELAISALSKIEDEEKEILGKKVESVNLSIDDQEAKDLIAKIIEKVNSQNLSFDEAQALFGDNKVLFEIFYSNLFHEIFKLYDQDHDSVFWKDFVSGKMNEFLERELSEAEKIVLTKFDGEVQKVMAKISPAILPTANPSVKDTAHEAEEAETKQELGQTSEEELKAQSANLVQIINNGSKAEREEAILKLSKLMQAQKTQGEDPTNLTVGLENNTEALAQLIELTTEQNQTPFPPPPYVPQGYKGRLRTEIERVKERLFGIKGGSKETLQGDDEKTGRKISARVWKTLAVAGIGVSLFLGYKALTPQQIQAEIGAPQAPAAGEVIPDKSSVPDVVLPPNSTAAAINPLQTTIDSIKAINEQAAKLQQTIKNVSQAQEKLKEAQAKEEAPKAAPAAANEIKVTVGQEQNEVKTGGDALHVISPQADNLKGKTYKLFSQWDWRISGPYWEALAKANGIKLGPEEKPWENFNNLPEGTVLKFTPEVLKAAEAMFK